MRFPQQMLSLSLISALAVSPIMSAGTLSYVYPISFMNAGGLTFSSQGVAVVPQFNTVADALTLDYVSIRVQTTPAMCYEITNTSASAQIVQVRNTHEVSVSGPDGTIFDPPNGWFSSSHLLSQGQSFNWCLSGGFDGTHTSGFSSAVPYVGNGTQRLSYDIREVVALTNPLIASIQYISGSTTGSLTVTYDYRCVGDISPTGGDGQINVDDLLEVLEHWGFVGFCDPAPACQGDVAPFWGVVDMADLLTILTHWGPCPSPGS